LKFLVGIRSREIEIELVGLRLGEEFTATGEGFQIEELIFDQTMHGFDIALIGMGRGWDAQVLAVAQRCGEARAMALRIVAADEFAAVVGLPGQVAQVHSPTIQVLLNASGEDGAGRRRAFLREGPEQQTATNFPRRVLHQR